MGPKFWNMELYVDKITSSYQPTNFDIGEKWVQEQIPINVSVDCVKLTLVLTGYQHKSSSTISLKTFRATYIFISVKVSVRKTIRKTSGALTFFLLGCGLRNTAKFGLCLRSCCSMINIYSRK